jgi:hypothetical protein
MTLDRYDGVGICSKDLAQDRDKFVVPELRIPNKTLRSSCVAEEGLNSMQLVRLERNFRCSLLRRVL